MSKKSKHHKPKGPRNPPQNATSNDEPTLVSETEQRVPNPKPDPPPPVDVKPAPEPVPVAKPAAPVKSESAPAAGEAVPSAAPVKPKRHRNRKKKHTDSTGDAGNISEGGSAEVKQEFPVSDVKKVEEKPKVVEQPIIKPNVEKVAEDKKEGTGKGKGTDQGKKGDNKKGENKKGGGGKTEDDKTKAKQPDKQEVVSENKNKGNQQQVKENVAQTQKGGNKKNEKVEEVKKDTQSAKTTIQVEEKKEIEIIKDDSLTTDENDSTGFVEAKSGKKSKSKNKKGKEVKEESSPAKIDTLPSVAPEPTSKAPVESAKIQETPATKIVEKVPTAEVPKPESNLPVNVNEQKGKKDKNKKKQNEKESTPKQSNTPTPKAEVIKVDEKKESIAPEAPPKTEECKKQPVEESDSLDDILPSLASSIEETLKKLIVCESDELFGQQLQAEEEKKRALEKKVNDEKKKSDNLVPQTITEKPVTVEDKGDKPKDVTTICQIIKPPEDINLLSKILHPEDIPKPIPLPFVPIHPVPESPTEAPPKSPEVPKGKEKNKKGDKQDQKKGKQEPACPLMNVQADACKLPPVSDKKEMPKLSDIMPSFSGIATSSAEKVPQADIKACPITEKVSSPNTPPQSPKVDNKQYDPPVMKSTISDELISALLSDIPPEFIAKELNPEIQPPVCSLPVTKSETVKENLPECVTSPKVSTPKDLISEMSVKAQDTISQIKDVIHEQLDIKKPIDVVDKKPDVCSIKPSLPTSTCEIKKQEIIAPIVENVKKVEEVISVVCEKGEEYKQKNKNKKQDKKKPDQAEQKQKGSNEALVQNKGASEIVPAAVTEQKAEDVPKKAAEEKTKCDPAAEIKTEVNPPVSPANVDSSKPTDSPKPAKRQKDKKNKQGGNKDSESQNVQTQSASSEGTASAQTQQTTEKTANSQKDKQANDGKSKTEQKSGQDKNSKGKGKTHSNTQTDITDAASGTQQPQETDSEKVNIINQDFQLLKATDLDADGSSKDDGKDPNRNDPKTGKRSPFKDHPKNLLGPSNIPAKSNKYDYKKEKNKDPEQAADTAKTKMKDVSPQHMPVVLDQKSGQSPKMQKRAENILTEQKTVISSSPDKSNIDKSIKHKQQCVDINNNIIEMDEEEEFVYKYSFRTVFIANACHICKIQLKEDRVVCRFCHLVGYCSEKHRDDDWMQHQSLCYSICTLSHVKGIDHIYGDAKSLSGQDYRLLRMQAIVSCEKLLKRKLCPWEQEVLLYPRICCEVSCRECKTSELKDCEMCGQVSYCANKPDHLPANHATWCQSYRLYHRLVTHQLTSGRIEPPLPSMILPDGYILPDKCSTLFDDLYGCVTNMDDCHYATLTQLSTAPLSALYAYQKAIAALQLIEQTSPEIPTGGPIDPKMNTPHIWNRVMCLEKNPGLHPTTTPTFHSQRCNWQGMLATSFSLHEGQTRSSHSRC